MTGEEIKSAVAERYGLVADAPESKFNFPVGRAFAESVGYEADLFDTLPALMWESFTVAGRIRSHLWMHSPERSCATWGETPGWISILSGAGK